MKQFKNIFLYAFFISFSFSQQGGANTSNDEPLTEKEKTHLQDIDGLAVIVGDKTILKSDINQALSMAIMRRRLNPEIDLEKIEKLKTEIIEAAINSKIVLAMAEKDSVEVQDKEVDRTLEDQINNIITQAGSEEEAEKALGQSLRTFRREYWYDVKDMLVAQKHQRELIRKISVNKKEVFSFYKKYKDSLPFFPTTVKLRHLLIKVQPSASQIDKTITLLKSFRQSLLDKEITFEKLAAQHSQDPGSKNSGGSLGFVRRGNLVTEFESVAFILKPGEISLPIKTEFGYHIIETQEIRGDKIKVRHILMSPPLTNEDETTAYNSALSFKDSSKTLSSFVSTIKSYSMDSQTKENGGALGWIDPETYPIPEIGMVLGQITLNECAGPVRSEFGYHLLWVESVKSGGKADIQKHWNEIETLTLNKKQGDWFSSWVDDSRKKLFINIVN